MTLASTMHFDALHETCTESQARVIRCMWYDARFSTRRIHSVYLLAAVPIEGSIFREDDAGDGAFRSALHHSLFPDQISAPHLRELIHNPIHSSVAMAAEPPTEKKSTYSSAIGRRVSKLTLI